MLTANTVVEVTNDFTKIPAPTAVQQTRRAAYISLIVVCLFGAGIYFVLSKHRNEGDYDTV